MTRVGLEGECPVCVKFIDTVAQQEIPDSERFHRLKKGKLLAEPFVIR